MRRPLLDNPRWFNEIITAYNLYKQGLLPNDGSYLAQPVGFIPLMSLVDQVVEECRTLRTEQEKKKNAGKNGRK